MSGRSAEPLRGRLLHPEGPVRLRGALGSLLACADTADFAIGRVRLAGVDLSAAELGAVRRCRVLVGRLDVGTLADMADAAGGTERRARMRALALALDGGRFEIRASGLDAWLPDFSVIRIAGGPSITLVGAHFLGTPPLQSGGPTFTCMLDDPPSAELASREFDALWRRGYDVLPVVRDVLEERLRA